MEFLSATIKVPTNIGDVKFAATRRQVIASTPGLPKIMVRQDEQGTFVAIAKHHIVGVGVTPELAFRRAANRTWLGR
jgi:hypothetical protein